MFKINKNVIIYKENDEVLLINMMTNQFYALDEISTYVWNEIMEGKKPLEIIHQLTLKFPEDAENIKHDINSFVHSLIKKKIINK